MKQSFKKESRRSCMRPTLLLPTILILITGFTACGLFGGKVPDDLLTVTPVSAVEAMLEIRAGKGDRITIQRDGTEIFSFRMNRSDTLVTDTGLNPTTSYIWKASNGHGYKTRQATTLDTTSSNFTWQTFTFGEHSSSVLYGVFIIDEDNIWAVGEIFMNDSTGQADSDIYNAAHWDGNKWELKRISVDFRGNEIIPPLEGIHTFSGSDIWVAGSLPIHGNGENWNIFDVRSTVDESLSLWEIWGIETTDMYAAGKNGSMAHWDGQTWQKIETGTDLDFYDIHGNPEQGVVAVAAQQSKSSDKAILRIKEDHSTKSLPTAPIPFSISGIWFDHSGVTYVVGSRISIKPNINSPASWVILDKDKIGHPYLFAIDANALNDISIAGAYGEILHFNGATWTSYSKNIYGNLYGIDMKADIVAAVGLDGPKAFITIGRRE